MIDLKQLRENPTKFILGAKAKGFSIDFDALLKMDEERRRLQTAMEKLRAEQKGIEKEIGPALGKLMSQMKAAQGDAKAALEKEVESLKAKPAALKAGIDEFDVQLKALEPRFNELLLTVPLPPDADVPVGTSADDNKEISRWNPPASELHPSGFDTTKSFEQNKGFKPKTHLELVRDLKLADFERGVKIGGTRSYILTGDGMRLHMAVQRFAIDRMVDKNGFVPMSVPVLVREEAMIGTGFFPASREQAYEVEESKRGGGYDMFLTGTGEVGLMGIHQGEILDESALPIKYVTVSTCFRREAGAAGKDTAGLYRIHQFDKVEQVVICKADEQESRAWHRKMIGFVEDLLRELEIPYRLLQCCTADLGPKNADMVDIESWMPGRGEVGADGKTSGAFGETHSASRLYDYQCRRLNMRYRTGGQGGKGETVFCHSLNNTVLASPRFLIPLLEMHQNKDGSVNIPQALRPYMGGKARIG